MNTHKLLIIIACFIVAVIVIVNRNEIFRGGAIVVVSTGTFQDFSTLSGMLEEENINLADRNKLINLFNAKELTRSIRSEHSYEIHKSTMGVLIKMLYWTNPVEYYSIIKSTSEKLSFEKLSVESTKEIKVFSGTIKDNLYNAMTGQGLSNDLTMRFTDIFSWQIDFFNDLRQGDAFILMYEQHKYKNGVVKDGKILVAKYLGKQIGEHNAMFFTSTNKKYNDYYAFDGGSLQKLFLRAPLSFRRISSYFTNRRFHPVLRYYRPHHGIDYSAASGTPVSAIGNGTVIFAGWRGGFGKTIIIKHNSTYTTTYGHLRGFAKGIRSGVRVNQGKVIAYVGSTGLSTGPHLDFRITQNGRYVNFLKLKLPPAVSVNKKYMGEFNIYRDNLLKQLADNSASGS
ncbi:MAG: hypothetical protein A2252_07900 [Elusimicrobia bacterium RIFOXYA2_FULL_39_19]|nr:MAG: hypothetical protein A2252_07900 [Elusimicrobia bacterium RIFOXYA2_FULL_39_19]